ncbi:MAG: hypothetical protein K0M45_04325 [Candidatus Paracaedibacteraceae bacterium]|nr:hypothetical protein [Candidatus Paracaedibacteraceae bacterium]
MTLIYKLIIACLVWTMSQASETVTVTVEPTTTTIASDAPPPPPLSNGSSSEQGCCNPYCCSSLQ